METDGRSALMHLHYLGANILVRNPPLTSRKEVLSANERGARVAKNEFEGFQAN
jgi:hypothetical protein